MNTKKHFAFDFAVDGHSSPTMQCTKEMERCSQVEKMTTNCGWL